MGVNFSKLFTTTSIAVLGTLGVAAALLAKAYRYRIENEKRKEREQLAQRNPQEHMEKPPSPKDLVMTESTNRTSATGTPRHTPSSAYGQRRMETIESAFDEHIHQPLENFCPEHILDRLIEDLNTLGEIQPESDGLLSFSDFCRIYGLV